ncbi:LamG domain-containing protein [Rathayibacter sp. VKM Ac-2630]|uniref:LamG domain-containing protein n=1 Tax=Rathayibacter sp. VKM Ac-2630 TaxID=1938617 RepID=UPI0011159FA2|nr:LamG domain-containing protein [Rathayibacter sp. VKM Ac-2630]
MAGAPALQQGVGSSAQRVSTPFGEGVSFNGSTDHLMVPKGELGPLNLGASTGAVTIAVWVLSSAPGGSCLAGVWEESTVGPLRSYALFNNLPEYGGWERVCMHVSKTGGPTPGYPFSRDYSVEPRRITRGVWQLHVGTYDGAEAVSYLDGTATGYPKFTDKLGATYAKNPYRFDEGLNAAPGDFVVGAVGRDGGMINRFKGTLARLRVWDRALTAEQVKELYTVERSALL